MPRVSKQGSKHKSSGEECSRILTKEDEIAVVNETSQLVSNFIAGRLKEERRNKLVDDIVARYASSPEKQGAVKATIAQASDLLASSWLMAIANDWGAQSHLTSLQINVLEGFGVSPELAPLYMDDVANYLRPSLRLLRENGFKFSEKGTWSFDRDDFSVLALTKFPENMAAFVSIFGIKIAADLRNGERRESVIIDEFVFLPPDAQGRIKVSKLSVWNGMVQRNLKLVTTETERFIKATREAASYSNLMTGRIVEWFGGERGLNGMTAPEIEAQASYKIILNAANELSVALGTGPDMSLKMLDLRKTLLAIESANLEEGLKKLDRAQSAAIAAPFVPLIIWAAPFAGGAMAPTWAVTIGNASAAAALTPLVIAAGSSVLSASIKSSTLGGGLLCNLYDDFVSKSSSALVSAPFMAGLPAAGALAAAGITGASSGAICVGSAYGTLNLGIAVFSIKSLMTAGVQGLGRCYDNAVSSEQAARAGNGALAQAKATAAMVECSDAGISLGFGAVQVGRLSKPAVEAIREKNLKPLIAGNCLALGGDGCGPTSNDDRKPLPTVKEFSEVIPNSGKLHQNISQSERYEVIKRVALEMTQSSPGHDYLRSPEKVVTMGQEIANSSDRGLSIFQGKDKIVLNVYTNSDAKVTGVEVMDGNHRFAAGLYAETLAPGKGWKTIGDIPKDFLEVRVNGFDTQGTKIVRWIPLHTVKEGNFPGGSWREIPPEWGAKGPTAEVAGDVSSTSSMFKPEHRGVSIYQVLRTSLNRIGISQ